MILIQLLVLFSCTGLLIFWFYYAFMRTINSAPFLPSSYKKAKLALQRLDINQKTKFLDIGSGDGRIVLLASKLGAGNSTGLEINPFLSLISRIILRLFGGRNTQIVQGDMFKHDYSQYNLIYTYLLPKTMTKVYERIEQQVKPGTIVISNTFSFKDKKPFQEVGLFKIYKF